MSRAVRETLAEGGRRGRRPQRGLNVLAGGCVALVLAGALGLVGTGGDPRPRSSGVQTPDAGSCPAQLAKFPAVNGGLPASAPGELAPGGAVRAVLCQYDAMPEWRVERPGPARQLVLGRDVTGLVAVLNELPVQEPIDPCFLLSEGGYLTLEYQNRTPITIEFSGLCSFVRRGDITRYNGHEAVQAFQERFREQELARAARDAVTPASCVPRLTPMNQAEARGRFDPTPVRDAWLHTFGPDFQYLAAPLAVVTACRYVRTEDGGLGQTRQVIDRGVGRELSDAIEATYRNERGEIPFLDCPSDNAVRTVDVLVLRDVVGETLEVRVLRDHCLVATFGFAGAIAGPELLSVLDRLLGRP
jgi:hypothetical protein